MTRPTGLRTYPCYVPVVLGAGTRLFDRVRSDGGLVPREALSSAGRDRRGTHDRRRGPLSPDLRQTLIPDETR